ncbi:MAG: hypothetical protein JSS53_09035 [Proteobacteria bacterium]|nr:hypothetical protein [Pseudomonadota bacterium]
MAVAKQPSRFFQTVDTHGAMTLTDARVDATNALSGVCKTVDIMKENKQGDNKALVEASGMLHEILVLCDNPNHQVVFTTTTPEAPGSTLG